MDNLEKKNFLKGYTLIPFLIIIGIIIIFGLVTDHNEKVEKEKSENEWHQYRIESDNRQREREAELQRHANIALNPLKVKSINFVCSRLSVTDLLKILIKYETQNAFDSYERDFRNLNLRHDISMVLIQNHHVNFSDTIAGYIVGEDVYFRMPGETNDRKANVSSEEMIRWVVESIYARKRDLQNVPANERNRSYLSYDVNERGDVEYKIIKK